MVSTGETQTCSHLYVIYLFYHFVTQQNKAYKKSLHGSMLVGLASAPINNHMWATYTTPALQKLISAISDVFIIVILLWDSCIGPQEFVVGYSKAPKQSHSSARPICHSHTMTSTGREPASIHIAAYRDLAALCTGNTGDNGLSYKMNNSSDWWFVFHCTGGAQIMIQ